MVTARSRPGLPRPRASAGVRRLLLVAVLVFGVVYTHVVSSEEVAHHLAPVGTTVSAPAGTQGSAAGTAAAAQEQQAAPATAEARGSAEGAGQHEDEGGAAHSFPDCLPGQPAQGPVLDAPAPSAWPGGSAVSGPSLGLPARGVSTAVGPPPGDATGSGVLRI